jgi:hypothetical protein
MYQVDGRYLANPVPSEEKSHALLGWGLLYLGRLGMIVSEYLRTRDSYFERFEGKIHGIVDAAIPILEEDRH